MKLELVGKRASQSPQEINASLLPKGIRKYTNRSARSRNKETPSVRSIFLPTPGPRSKPRPTTGPLRSAQRAPSPPLTDLGSYDQPSIQTSNPAVDLVLPISSISTGPSYMHPTRSNINGISYLNRIRPNVTSAKSRRTLPAKFSDSQILPSAGITPSLFYPSMSDLPLFMRSRIVNARRELVKSNYHPADLRSGRRALRLATAAAVTSRGREDFQNLESLFEDSCYVIDIPNRSTVKGALAESIATNEPSGHLKIDLRLPESQIVDGQQTSTMDDNDCFDDRTISTIGYDDD